MTGIEPTEIRWNPTTATNPPLGQYEECSANSPAS